MTRPKDGIWSHFGEMFRVGGVSKTQYCKCKACGDAVIAASARMRDHWGKCKKRPRAIGQLDAGFLPYNERKKKKTATSDHSSSFQQEGSSTAGSSSASSVSSQAQRGLGAFSPSGNTVVVLKDSRSRYAASSDGHSSFFSGGRQHFDSLKAGEKDRLDELFARAVHRTATPFSAFEHPSWKAFFRALRGCYQLPSMTAIAGDLMREEYTKTMNDVLLVLGKQQLICLTLDGATNIQGKQVINMMACGPKAYFLEHFKMELRRESAANLLEKLMDCKLRLLASIRQPAPGCTLLRVGNDHGGANDDSVAEQQGDGGLVRCSKNEHFSNPPIFCFCSDSPSVMVKLRKDCIATKEFTFAYGCAPHAIHNLCMDLVKHFPGIKAVLKQILFMVKTLKSSHLLLALFDKLCLEKYKKTYVLILFTKTRRGTIYFAAQRANLVKAACAALPSEILNSDLDIDICEELKRQVTDPMYWKGVAAMETLFKTISSCLTYLEGDEATFLSVYACFVAIKFHLSTLDASVKDNLNLTDANIEHMIQLTHHRFSTIYTEAHGLAFATDPMFFEMRTSIAAMFNEEFLQLGKASINQQLKLALTRLANGNENLRRKMYSEFAHFITCGSSNDYDTNSDFEDVSMKPSELWTLCDDNFYGTIKLPISAIHRNPAGASGGERNHKSANRVHSRSRARMGNARVESGTAILFNAKQLDRQISPTRDTRFCKWLQKLGSSVLEAAGDNNMDSNDDDNDGDEAIVVDGAGHKVPIIDDDDVGDEEFDRIDMSGGVSAITDRDLFVGFEDELEDTVNILDEGEVLRPV